MTREQLAGLELEGEGEHALLKTPIDHLDTLRIHQYATDRLSELMPLIRYARETGDTLATQQSEEGLHELVDTVIPRYRAALHQAGLNLRVLGSPNQAPDLEIGGGTAAVKDVMDAVRGSNGDFDRISKALVNLKTPDFSPLLIGESSATWGMFWLPGDAYISVPS